MLQNSSTFLLYLRGNFGVENTKKFYCVTHFFVANSFTLSWRRFLSYRNCRLVVSVANWLATCTRKPKVLDSSQPMCRGELSGVITRVMSSVCEAGGSGRVDLKRNSLNLPLLSCKSGVFVEENLGRKKIRNQSMDLLCRSMDWFLYDRDLHHERFNTCCPQKGQIYLNLGDNRC